MVKFGWDKLKRFLAQANTWSGTQTFSNINVTGGTVTGITDLAIADGGTGASTAATAFANLKQAATSSTSGVTVYSGSTKALAGTDTASAMTPADVAAAQAVLAREPDQGVALTAGAAAAIYNAHSTVYSNTTNSFGIGGDFILPSWTPAAKQVLRNKWAANVGYKLEVVLTSGAFVLYLNEKTYTSAVPGGGAASNLVAGTRHKILAVPTVGASTTTVSFYLDGHLLSTTEAQANEDVTNTQDMYTGGTSAARYTMIVYDTYDFNYAHTTDQAKDLFRNGIAEADKWGSQTAIYTSDFSADTGWTLTNGAAIAGNVLTYAANALQGVAQRTLTPTPLLSQYIAITYEVITNDSNTTLRIAGGDVYAGGSVLHMSQNITSTVGVHTAYLKVTGLTIRNVLTLQTVAAVSTGSIVVDNLSIIYCGATLALQPEGIQPAPGQWLDSSSNKLHAMQPAAGSSLTRYKKDFEYRWTNTWTASSAAQYVGGLNQAVLSADHFITDVITQATVTTDVENLTLGDGSAADKFVAAFAPSATRTKQTVAAQNDGTNLKLVYTPAAEATMTVETIIRGFIWEP
jgi:hypothetical protein